MTTGLLANRPEHEIGLHSSTDQDATWYSNFLPRYVWGIDKKFPLHFTENKGRNKLIRIKVKLWREFKRGILKPCIIEIGPVVSNMTYTETDKKNGNKHLFFLFVKFLTIGHSEKASLETETCSRLAAGW